MSSPESWELRRGKISSTEFWKWAEKQLPKGKHYKFNELYRCAYFKIMTRN